MKVLCIDALNLGSHPKITEGEVYTVSATESTWWGDLQYFLEEITEKGEHGFSYCYSHSRFIPLSEIDEMQLSNEAYESF
jgi:hypothetical protein